MPKLDFDYEKIQTYILPSLENSFNKLKKSYNNCFFDAGEFSGKVTSIREKIQVTQNNVDSLEQWLENSINLIRRTSEVLENDARSLPVCEIKLRESPINFK